MRTWIAGCVPVMLVMVCTLAGATAQERQLTAFDLVGPYLLGSLVDAGYRPDDPSSLVLALTSAPPEVSAVAAIVLSLFPEDPRVVPALQNAARVREEVVAFSAFRALLSLKATGWEDTAVVRMGVMESRAWRIQLAAMLAQTGRVDGWPIVKEALAAERSSVGLAIQNVVHFDGLKDRDGGVIDVAAELQGLLKRDAQRLSTYHRDAIQRELEGVNARRSARSQR